MSQPSPGVVSEGGRGAAESFVALLLRWRLVVLGAVLLGSVLAFFAMSGLYMDNSNEAFFMEGDPTIELLNRFRETFGNEDFICVTVATEDFFEPETIRLVKRLAEDLEANLPYIERMTWIGNVEHVTGTADGINISELMAEVPESAEEIDRLRRRALGDPEYVDNLISGDGRNVAILLECERYPENRADPRKEIPPVLDAILAQPAYAALTTYAVGSPIQDYELDRITARETVQLGLVCALLQMLLLLRVGRGIRAVFAPLLVVILSIVWTLGIIAVVGWPLSLMAIMLPTLLLCVGIGDAVHIIAEYHQQRDRGMERRAALVATIRTVAKPCLLTSLTTAAGFLSFLSTKIVPIRLMGVFSAIGVVVAFIISLLLVPIILSYGKEKKRHFRKSKPDVFDGVLRRVVAVNVRYPRLIVSCFVLLAAVAAAGYRLIEVETSSIRNFNRSLAVRRAYDFVDSAMGGSMAMEIVLDTGRPDGVKDLSFLNNLDRLQDFVEQHPLGCKAHSVLNTLKRMRRAMHENREEFYALPDSQRQAAEYLFLYEGSGGENLDQEVSFLYDTARLHVRTRSLGTREVRSFISDIDRFIAGELDEALEPEYTGYMPWVRATSDYVAEGQRTCFTWAFVAIAVMMILVLGSLRLGLISMLPNLIPVLLSLGIMGYLRINMSIVLMVFSPVVIGVAVDDTVHFFLRFRRGLERTKDYRQSIADTIVGVGRPLVFTTLILMVGFGVFALSKLSTSVQFGLLAGFAFFWALAADLLLAPALLILIKPLRKDRRRTPG